MFSAGILTPTEAAELSAMRAELTRLRQRVDELTVPPDAEIDVAVTAYDSGTGYCTWTRQLADASGVYYDDPTGFGGDNTYLPLVERNGRILSAFPVFASARPRLGQSAVGAIYEFTAPTAAPFARFSLPSSLATTDASKASCTVDGYWGGADPGGTITVYNLPASSNYIFSGASGNKGLATWDDVNGKWWIIQLQCP